MLNLFWRTAMSRCPICFGDMIAHPDGKGAYCDKCGVHYTSEQIARLGLNKAPEFPVQTLYVNQGVITSSARGLVDVVIPEGVVEIGDRSFWGGEIRTLVIPDTVTKIGANAFSECRNLEKICFGSGLREVNDRAFENCFSLKEVHVKDVASWCKISFNRGHGPGSHSTNPFAVVNAKLFIDGKEVKHLVIPEMTTIGAGQFAGCSSIEKVTCGIGVSFKGYGQFEFCDNLKELHFEGSPRDVSGVYLPKGCKVTSAKEEQAKNASEILTGASSNVMKIIEDRKEKGLCAHCGGKFTLITKTCKFCGKKKDY